MYIYQIHLTIAGGTVYFLCTVLTVESLASLIAALASVPKPEYSSIEIRIIPKG